MFVHVLRLLKSMSARTETEELPGPTVRSSRACNCPLICADCAACWATRASPTAPPPAAPCAESRAPVLSATVTLLGSSLGIEEETRCTIASTWPEASVWFGLGWTTTEAFVVAWSRVKTSGSGSARLTVAVCTVSICWIAFFSSPSVARLTRIRCWESEVVSGAFSTRG